MPSLSPGCYFSGVFPATNAKTPASVLGRYFWFYSYLFPNPIVFRICAEELAILRAVVPASSMPARTYFRWSWENWNSREWPRAGYRRSFGRKYQSPRTTETNPWISTHAYVRIAARRTRVGPRRHRIGDVPEVRKPAERPSRHPPAG